MNRPLTILNVSQGNYVRGGSDRFFIDVGKLLERNGHRVITFAAQDPRNEPSEWAAYFPEGADFDRPTPIDLARFMFSPEARRNLARLIDDTQPDVVYLHIYYGKLTSSILKPLHDRGIPILHHLHEYRLICPVHTLYSRDHICEACRGGRFYQALLRRCNRGSLARTALNVAESYVGAALGARSLIDHFVVGSQFVRDKMIDHGVAAELISLNPYFVTGSTLPTSQPPGHYFLYFGRIERIKGVFTLAEASAELGVPLVIVGVGEAAPELEALIEAKGWRHIEMRGFQSGEKLTETIRGAICVVVPSEWYEPFGLVALEAFQQCRPVIGSRIGGLPEVISDGQDGILVLPGDAAALRQALIWMRDHSDEARMMGNRGFKKTMNVFTEVRHYQRLNDILSQFV